MAKRYIVQMCSIVCDLVGVVEEKEFDTKEEATIVAAEWRTEIEPGSNDFVVIKEKEMN